MKICIINRALALIILIGTLCVNPVFAELTEEERAHVERHMERHDSKRKPTGRMPDDQNPFISGPPEVRECLKRTLGEKRFNAIKDGKNRPTDEDEKKIGSCIQQRINATVDSGEVALGPGHEDSWHLRDENGMPFGSGYKETGQEPDKFIVANPIDLTEIAAFSKFRSCMGHDYSGWNLNGIEEKNRSMKHYVIQRGDVKQAKVFAPFDGKITEIEDDGPRGDQVWITPNVHPHWRFVFEHIEFLSGIKLGSDVKAGQQIGYSVAKMGGNFDYGLKKFEMYKGPNIHAPLFNYMTAEVLAEYRRRGVTPENMFISKDDRDANPCVFAPGSGSDELVYLKQK